MSRLDAGRLAHGRVRAAEELAPMRVTDVCHAYPLTSPTI
jgi:hypothetical protein